MNNAFSGSLTIEYEYTKPNVLFLFISFKDAIIIYVTNVRISRLPVTFFFTQEMAQPQTNKQTNQKAQWTDRILELHVSSTREWNTKLGKVVVMSLFKHMEMMLDSNVQKLDSRHVIIMMMLMQISVTILRIWISQMKYICCFKTKNSTWKESNIEQSPGMLSVFIICTLFFLISYIVPKTNSMPDFPR